MRQSCPFHADDDVEGSWVSPDVGYAFECDRKGHPIAGSYHWTFVPEPPGAPGMSGLAKELGLDVHLPEVVASFGGRWVEYGVVERAFAAAHPSVWVHLVDLYGHTAKAPKQFTVSSFLAKVLGSLRDSGDVDYRDGKASGRWSYNSRISWWASHPSGDWDDRLSWEADGPSTRYVPGSTEKF